MRIIFIFLCLSSFSASAEVAKIVATIFNKETLRLSKDITIGTSLIKFFEKDHKGNLAALTTNEVVLYSPEGKELKRIQHNLQLDQSAPLKRLASNFKILSQTYAIQHKHFNKADHTWTFFDFFGTKLGEHPGTFLIEYNDNSVLLLHSNSIYHVGVSGQVRDSMPTGGVGPLFKTANGTVVACKDSREGYIELPACDNPLLFINWETKKVIGKVEIANGTMASAAIFDKGVTTKVWRYDLFVSKDETIIINQNGFLHFYQATGTLKKKLTIDQVVRSLLALPDGNVAALNGDGKIYIYDSDANLKYSHLHDSEAANKMIMVTDKTFAYWNKTQIVFVDLQGKEISTMTPTFQKNGNKELLGLGNGNFLAFGMVPDSVYFIKATVP